MPPTIRASAVLVACVAVAALAPPAVADPSDRIPGNGVFIVGPDIAPGLYRHGRDGVYLGRLDKQHPDPGRNVLVVYLQHTRCEQGPCSPGE